MKHFSSLLLATLLGSASSVSAQAAPLIDIWSVGGGAWDPANQPNFTVAPGGGGTLYTDEAIASSTNTSGLNTRATWNSAVPLGPPYSGVGIYTDYYYTLFSTPAVTIHTSNVLASVDTITFELTTAATFVSGSLGLSFSGAQGVDGFTTQFIGIDPGFGSNIYAYTWTWDVSATVVPASFSLNWTTPTYHTAYFEAELTQIQAVPEPSTTLFLVMGLGMLLWRFRRNAALSKTC